MKRLSPLVSLLALALLPGCDALWNVANRGGLERDFKVLAQSCGVHVTLTRCRMLGTTREGTCEFTASCGQLDSLVRGLSLKPVEPGSVEESFLKRIEASPFIPGLLELDWTLPAFCATPPEGVPGSWP